MNLCAVDPGLSGSLAILHNGEVTTKSLPIAGRDLDLATLSQWLKEASTGLAVVEKVHSMPGQGVASMFKFAKGTEPFWLLRRYGFDVVVVECVQVAPIPSGQKMEDNI